MSSPMALSKTADPTSRAIPLLPFLAGATSLLRRQHKHRRHLRRKKMFAGDGRLLRMLAPQEGGELPLAFPQPKHTIHGAYG